MGIIGWRNLREIYRVLRGTPAALGMVVDWGYRPEDVPVRLFGAWTTLPAGPATLAARTRAVILPVAAYHLPETGGYRHATAPPLEVADASPRSIAIATQAIADALESFVRAAPEQWHTFKPMWPATEAEERRLEARAMAMLADDVSSQVPGPRGVTGASTSTDGIDGFATRFGARLLLLGVAVLQRSPDRLVYRLGFRAGRIASRFMGGRRALARANLARVCGALVATGRATPRVSAAARDGRALDGLVRDLFGHWFVAYLESAIAPRYDEATIRRRIHVTDPGLTAAAIAPVAVPDGPGPIFTGLHLGAVEMAGIYATRTASMRIAGPMERVRNPILADYFLRTRGAIGFDLIPIRDASVELLARIRRGDGVALVADRPIGGAGTSVQLFGAPCRLAGRAGRAGRGDRRATVRARRACATGRETGRATSSASRCPRRAAATSASGRRSTGRSPRSRGSSHTHPSSGGHCCSASGRTSRRHDRGRRSGDRRRRARPHPRLVADWPEGAPPPTDRPMSRADLHIHTLASDGVDGVEAILGSRARGAPQGHRHHRPRADRRGGGRPAAGPGTAGCRSRSSWARRSPPATATSSRCSSSDASSPGAACATRSPRSTTRAASPSWPIRWCPIRCAPARAPSGGSSTRPTRRVTRMPSRPSTPPPRGCAGAPGCPRSRSRPGSPRSPAATRTARSSVGRAITRFRGDDAEALRRAILDDATAWEGTAVRLVGAARHVPPADRQERARRPRHRPPPACCARAIGRDLGYPR